jgi:hypothetical protein
MLQSGALQARLSVNPPDDVYEREAERTADLVTRLTTEPSAESRFGGETPSIARLVQRSASGKGEEERKEDDEPTPLQKAPSERGGPTQVGAGVESAIARMSAGGDPLPDALRAYFEPRFGYDFGAVRTHADAGAAGAAASLQARAFTVGQHVFFGAGQYQPDSASGRGLLAHELTHTVQQSATRAQPARVQRDFLDDPRAAVLGKLREWALELPPYELLTVILGKDPFTDQVVERTAVGYVRAVLKLVPDGEAIFADLQQSKTIEKTAEYLAAEVAKLDITWTGIKRLFGEAWDSLDALDLVRPAKVWETVRTVFAPTFARLTRFALAVGGKLVVTIREQALARLSAWAQTLPGFLLLTLILGRNPITGEPVERTARTFVKAVLELVPGGDRIFENLEKANAIERTVKWLEAEITKLDLTVEAIVALFRKAWDVLRVTDLLDPLGLVAKIRAIFEAPARRVLAFALAVGKKVLEFVFEGAMLLAGPLGEQIVRITRKIGDTFTRIVEDPVGFLRNLLDAVKQGFGQFSANILDHLRTGIFEWLLGALEGAGLQLPAKWDLAGILSVVLQVLGITYAKMRAKMVKLIGEPRVAFLEGAFDFIKALVTRGPIAAWERIVAAIGSFTDLVIGGIKDWAITKIVTAAITKLVTLFNPVGAVVQAIITIYNTVAFFIERIKQILALVEAIVDSIANIVAGKLEAAANYVERSMARTIPVILGFLARLIGLGDVSGAIKNVITGIQEKVDMAIDRMIAWVVETAKSLFGRTEGDKAPPEEQSKHQQLLEALVPRLEEEDPNAAETDEEWLAGKRARAEALEKEAQPELEPGVRISIDVEPTELPRQFAFALQIAPNTIVLAGASAPPPTLTLGADYVFFVDFRGNGPPRLGKFSHVFQYNGQWSIKFFDPGERETERKTLPNGDLVGKFRGGGIVPAYQASGAPNFRLAAAGAGEPPVFRLVSSRTAFRGGTQPLDVEAEPLALTTKASTPYEEPPGLARIAAPLKSSGAWVPGHLVNASMGGPGSNENLAPIDIGTNAKMRGNYENNLRKDLQLGSYFFFHVHVDYYSANASKTLGHTEDFAERLSVDWEEITRSGSTWARTGATGTAGPYTVPLPTVAELDPNRLNS